MVSLTVMAIKPSRVPATNGSKKTFGALVKAVDQA
jgi:hypothetical protein